MEATLALRTNKALLHQVLNSPGPWDRWLPALASSGFLAPGSFLLHRLPQGLDVALAKACGPLPLNQLQEEVSSAKRDLVKT